MMKKDESGFTLIEILMVVILVGIISAVAIPQFIDFRTDATNASTQANLAALRTAISNQYAQMISRCDGAAGTYPSVAQINANDITTGGAPCVIAELEVAADAQFLTGGIPDNPWGTTNTVTGCTDCDPTNDDPGTITTACDGVNFTGGWCYNTANGNIWADSANNGGTVGGTLEPNF